MMRRLALYVMAFVMAALSGLPASAKTIAIINGTVATIANPDPIENGTVIMRDGRIAAVGAHLAVPSRAEVIDAKGGWVTPGLIAAYSKLGLIEVGLVKETDDLGASGSPYNAAIVVAPAINPRATAIPVTRIAGITRAAVVPDASSDVFGGQGLVMSLGEGDDFVTKPRAFQFIVLGEGGSAKAGGSRGALYARIVDAFAEAQAYARNPAAYDFGRNKYSLLTKADAAALSKVVSGETPAMVYVNRASDILQILKLKKSYPRLRLILAGASEGWTVADRIADAGVPVVSEVMLNLPEHFETLAATQSNIGRMVRAGVKVAIAPVNGDATHQVRLMPQQAGNLVAQSKIPGGQGISHAQALAAMTRVPAEILGISGSLGTIERGKIADIVIWSGDPIALSSAPTAVFIEGEPVVMESRQTKLRDRYNPRNTDVLPKQYRR